MVNLKVQVFKSCRIDFSHDIIKLHFHVRFRPGSSSSSRVSYLVTGSLQLILPSQRSVCVCFSGRGLSLSCTLTVTLEGTYGGQGYDHRSYHSYNEAYKILMTREVSSCHDHSPWILWQIEKIPTLFPDIDEGTSDGALDDSVFGGANSSCLTKASYWYIGISGLAGERPFHLNSSEFCYPLNKLHTCHEEARNTACVYEYC